MRPIVSTLLLLVSTMIRSRLSLQLEIVALRHVSDLCVTGLSEFCGTVVMSSFINGEAA